MTKRVIYGESNYATIVAKNGYFVDKTAYIAKLEGTSNPIFLRPRRFGKSLFCSLLRYYYDLNYAERFAELFAQTWMGQQPTPNHNRYIVLFLNFSGIDVGQTMTEIEHSFKNHCNSAIGFLRTNYPALLHDMPTVIDEDAVADNLQKVLNFIYGHRLPPLYIIIDEYDNFANQLITSNQDQLYQELTAPDGFLKTFFKTIKAGRESAAIANIFITGVLPITIDELASAFNVGTFLTLEPGFEAMLGKYHERFAGLRWVVEFKYRSHHEMKEKKIRLDHFTLPVKDTEQIRGYAQGLQREYPEAHIALFVIYCFGNQGFRVFPVENVEL